MYLLDTNVLSEVQKPAPDLNVLAFMGRLTRTQSYTSALVVFELLAGIELNPSAREAAIQRRFVDWLTGDRCEGRVLDYDLEVARTHARLVGELKRAGRPKPRIDLQIAATALTHGLVLVTRNLVDFADMGLELFSPWERAAG